jgi:glycosyltransferase involved in cell wall biosynthesis
LKVLIFNRRDIKNPEGGGAEVYTHEIARALAERGDDVTVFSSRFRGAPPKENINGIRHLRRGNELTVHFRGFLHAWRHRKEFDLIIDQFNGIGFFCFPIPGSILLIHQMYRKFWLRELGPLGVIPYLVEPLLLRLYAGKPAITVSESTRRDLEGMGIKDIHIVMNALGRSPVSRVHGKEPRPTLIFLGRLRSTKKPEDSITIFRAVRREVPAARLWVVGRGPEEERLKKMAAGLDGVTFWGWQDDDGKFDLLRRAHVLLVPGVREGFGINVIEAASQGTPSVGYDIHGLRDSIKDGQTGFLAAGPEEAAEKAVRLLKDPDLYAETASRCLEYSRDFDWKKRREEFRQVVTKLVQARSSARGGR